MAAMRPSPFVTHTATDIRKLLDRHGFDARRALGQNFVVDPNTVRKMAVLSGAGVDSPVVEIGPGLGSLTLALVEVGARVTAVEVDPGLVVILRAVMAEVGAGDRVEIIEGDARAVDWPTVLGAHPRWQLVANLPYNVATPMILDLLRDVPQISSMLVMVQREVAERLVAGPGDAAIGIPSVVVSYFGTATIAARVPATVFHPKPRVESAIVRIDRHVAAPIGVAIDEIDPLVRTAYGQRRKMLRRSLGNIISGAMFAAARVDPEARPEKLDIEAWGRLAEVKSR